MRKPKAENWPGWLGTMPLGMLALTMRSATWTGPAPPKASRVKSRGSSPRSVSTERSAPIMLLLAICTMASAVSSTGLSMAPAIAAMALDAASASSAMAPPRKFSGLMRPMARLASVAVARVPPRP